MPNGEGGDPGDPAENKDKEGLTPPALPQNLDKMSLEEVEKIAPEWAKHIRELRDKDAKRRLADKEAADKKLADDGKFKELAASETTRANDAEAKLKDSEARVKQLNDVVNSFIQQQIEAMPEADRDLVPDLDDPVKKGEWLNKYHKRATKQAGDKSGEKPPPDKSKEKEKKPGGNAPNIDAGTQGLTPEQIATQAEREAAKQLGNSVYRF